MTARLVRRLLGTRELGIVLVLLVEAGCFAWLLREPGRANPFLRPEVMLDLVRDSAVLGLAAIGACITIIAGGIDLSVGSLIALSAVVTAAALERTGLQAPAAALCGLGVGTGCGLLSAQILVRFRLPPFIVTLGMLSVARGAAYLITRGRTIVLPISPFTERFGSGAIELLGLRVPMPVVVLAVTAVIFAGLMSRTAIGRSIFALGGNEEAARLSGVRVDRLKHLVYGLGGFTAGLAGCVYAAYYGTGQSTAAVGWELDAIAAAVLGGASLQGGRGSVAGACIGAVIFRVLDRGLTMLGASDYRQVIVGLVVITVVILDQATTTRAEGLRRVAGKD